MTTMGEPIRLSDYDYELPPELIAQQPIEPRDAARLLVLDRRTGRIEHRIFREIGDYLQPGDLLVVNDSRVLPARLFGRRGTGGQVELLLLQARGDGRWEALARPARRLRPGEVLTILPRESGLAGPAPATILERLEEGRVLVQLPAQVLDALDRYGHVPLPPYIRQALRDPERYQTVYARELGSVAAPTAGLHFTPELLERLQRLGVGLARVTLHVGLGTFKPVQVEDVRQHRMHAEWYHVPAETLSAIRSTRERGHRVVAVGTTSARTLESISDRLDEPGDLTGWTDLFIVPGHRWRVVDALITNFHLPRSTLLLLVCSFAGRELVFRAYREAVERGYRFYSFGDATLIL
jgi:S-adenosylmethionine:tRNA ribosyltransferase-isomerase